MLSWNIVFFVLTAYTFLRYPGFVKSHTPDWFDIACIYYEQFDICKDFYFVLFRDHSKIYFTLFMVSILIPFNWSLASYRHKDFKVKLIAFFGFGEKNVKFSFIRREQVMKIGAAENIP